MILLDKSHFSFHVEHPLINFNYHPINFAYGMIMKALNEIVMIIICICDNSLEVILIVIIFSVSILVSRYIYSLILTGKFANH